MKRRIDADWDHTVNICLGLSIALLELPPLIISILSNDMETIRGTLLFEVIFTSIIVFICLLSPKCGLTIDYRKERIKYVGYTKPKFIYISQIDHIEIKELQAEKRKIYIPILDIDISGPYLMNVPRDYVYRNGKIFDIVVYKKDGTEIKYPYTVMYQARSKKRVMKHEAKMRAILDELNAYIASNDRWHSIMSEI